MLVEKEVISPGTYWYTDETTGLPRKLDVSSEMTKYWHDQGKEMLNSGLTIPVPFEHDFNAHPMTPKDRLLNNAGWVKEYRLHDGNGGKGNRLFGIVDVQDEDIAKKLPKTIRWSSPWISSFTDGNGKQWNNVISHLALTTRPRIIQQAPFQSIAAALSMASDAGLSLKIAERMDKDGFCLTRAGRLVRRKKDGRVRPLYPVAFAMISGAKFANDDEDMKPLKKKGKDSGAMGGMDDMDDMDDMDGTDEYEDGGEQFIPDDNPANDSVVDLPPLGDPAGDVKMEELLCDLLNALGVTMPDNVSEAEFKRALYEASMTKIKELTAKGQASNATGMDDPTKQSSPTSSTSNTSPMGGQANPIIQQEQQPMYMSLDEIQKLPEPMKGIALAMYAENQKLRAEVEANAKTANSLRDVKLREETAKRASRISLICRLAPRVKPDLESMMKLPSMALSMGDGGNVVDPMDYTLTVLEKGLSDIPRLLTTEATALSVQAQPVDNDLDEEELNKLADDMARRMGCPADKKAS